MTVEQYSDLVLSLVEPLEPRSVPLARAHGLVLAESIHAPHDLPRIDRACSESDIPHRAGDDLRAGALAIAQGAVVQARSLAVIAACGRRTVLAHPRVRVSVVSTGDELCPQGAAADPDQVIDSNGPMLAAAATSLGCEVRIFGPVADDATAFRQALRNAVKGADIVLTSGGINAGAGDTARSVLLRTEGYTFADVAMHPGTAQGVGRYAGVPVLAMPGNPVSAYVSFIRFAAPAIRRLQGRTGLGRVRRTATLRAAIDSPAGKLQYARGILQGMDELTVTPVRGQGAHHLSGLAHATALIVVPPEVTHLEAGSRVQVVELEQYEGA